MKHCYWLKYNNYANRILKVSSQLSDYKGVDNANVIYHQEDMELWNPNDGITTTVKAGTVNNSANFTTEPDYFICTDGNGVIDSRWFVIENRRLRKGQYLCVLKRDVFADDLENFKKAKCHISRGLLQKNNKLIFNDENLNVNQIIAGETMVTDPVGCPWLILYAAENITNTSGTLVLNQDYDIEWTGGTNFSDFLNSLKTDYTPNDIEDIQATLNFWWGALENDLGRMMFVQEGPVIAAQGPGADNGLYARADYVSDFSRTSYLASEIRTAYNIKTHDQGARTYADGTRVKWTDANNVAHVTKLIKQESFNNTLSVRVASRNTLFDELELIRTTRSVMTQCVPDPGDYRIYVKYNRITYIGEDITGSTINYAFNASGYHPEDAPYIIWAIPYGNITVNYDGTDYVTSPDAALAVANRMMLQNTEKMLYDVQILPYCPLPDQYISAAGKLVIETDASLTSDTTIYHTEVIDGVTTNVPDNFIFCVSRASFTRRCMLPTAITIDDPKFRDTVDLYRVYAPNYSASFEFSAARNGGLLGFNIRCTYMPFNPYLRIAPIWGGIYGSSGFIEDVRGLICSGDYSIARVTDAWISYQEQNKNYEAIFNRQISNMDIMHKYDRIEKIAGAISGTASAGSIGAIAGGITAGIGATGSAIAGIADVALNEQRFSEQKKYSRDMFQLNLGNVQAMPRTISRTTAYTIDNRYFPVFVRYTCTGDEMTAVSRYFVENSFRVDAIGKPEDFMSVSYKILNLNDEDHECRGFLSGQIIKIDTDKDTHYIDELNNEFTKGVYMK